jgi:hypothetical protein
MQATLHDRPCFQMVKVAENRQRTVISEYDSMEAAEAALALLKSTDEIRIEPIHQVSIVRGGR